MIKTFAIALLVVQSAFMTAQAETGSPLQTAAQLLSQGELPKAVELLEPLAQAGNPAAQHNLGMIYANGGSGIHRDAAKALSYYKMAARSRFLPSIHNIGVMYQLGQAVDRDYTQALTHYYVTARFGYTPAFSSLAYLYANGLGDERDLVTAYGFLLIADSQGDQHAQANLRRLRAALTKDQIEQGEIFADLYSKRVIANIKACQKEIATTQKMPFDENTPPEGMLLVGCGF